MSILPAYQPPPPKSLWSYALLPGIVPRLRGLFSGGFGLIAYFVLVVFNVLRIVPDDHPALRGDKIGALSILQALRITAGHIDFNLKNIDKVLLFFVVIAGLFMMGVQGVLFLVVIFALPAFAYGGPAGNFTTYTFFANNNAAEDIAFRLLDMVFGIPGIYGSKDMGTTPFHEAFHALLAFYSYGILFVGFFIIIYLTIAVVMETAHYGVPFGKRFNHAWVPIRLALFFGLLIPMTSGINLAQYTVFEASKWGSNLATNGWILFDRTFNNAPYLGPPEQLIVRPTPPSLSVFVSFMQLARTCSAAEGRIAGRDIKAYAVFRPGAANAVEITGGAPSLNDFITRSNGGSIRIRFGVQNETRYAREDGAVFPYCGEVRLDIVDQAQPGALMIQQAYLEMIACLWHSGGGYSSAGGNALGANPRCARRFALERGMAYSYTFSNVAPLQPSNDIEQYEHAAARAIEISEAQTDIAGVIERARAEQVNNGQWTNTPAIQFGWGGAAIWYNKIAQQNGAFMSAVHNLPTISRMPSVMEFVRDRKVEAGARVSNMTLYAPTMPDGTMIVFPEPNQRDIALTLNQLYMYWGAEQSMSFFAASPDARNPTITGNALIDMMNAFLGTSGLFNMCRNTDIHPLAQLAGVGRALIEHSIRGIAGSAVFGALGFSISNLLNRQNIGAAFSAISSSLMSFAMIGLTLGFILFYVVPFLPFVYFFFAVSTWVKGIFEAIVAMPLWALAHLKIDGPGMPGPAASSGYFYILEIFLRPICIILGFLIGVAIFTAMVKVLNQIFYVAISNFTGQVTGPTAAGAFTGCFVPPGGADSQATPVPGQFIGGVVDEFFYTVLYAIVVYLIASASFKLVDAVPDTIMRWLGVQISSFGSADGDPAAGLMSYVSGGVLAVNKGFAGAGQAFLIFR